MADGIYYNAEVTSDDLNDLARDLGNTSFNGFGEEKFGADELNGITASLVSKGILTSESKCQPIIIDGNVNIQPGTIVFQNGAKKAIKEVLSVPVVNHSYIYVLNDTAAGTCELIVSENNPAEDENVMSLDYIPIAFIDDNGALTDKRTFAIAHVRLPGSNTYYEKEITHLFSANIVGDDVIVNIDVNFPFRYAWIHDYHSGDNVLMVLTDDIETGRISVGYYESVSFLRSGTNIKLLGHHSGRGAETIKFTVYFA